MLASIHSEESIVSCLEKINCTDSVEELAPCSTKALCWLNLSQEVFEFRGESDFCAGTRATGKVSQCHMMSDSRTSK